MLRLIVTGGAGFIGSALARHLVGEGLARVCVLDSLTYAGHLSSLREVEGNELYSFAKLDICDHEGVSALFREFRPDGVLHLAAESHVDRSIADPLCFVRTNVLGTGNLLECATEYWRGLHEEGRRAFRFLHVSTDEVYGSLKPGEPAFTETSPYAPKSPYSASKAAGDHLVEAWGNTYGLPTLLSHCTNNYGAYQFPEKLIPRMTLLALAERPLPVYGTGENVRDWLSVEDHVRALWQVYSRGVPGGVYNIGGACERTNREVVHGVCRVLDELRPRPAGRPYEELICQAPDRPGHDLRYAMDIGKIRRELGWEPRVAFGDGLRETVRWYLENDWWWRPFVEEAVRPVR